jgi:hypothetical protein
VAQVVLLQFLARLLLVVQAELLAQKHDVGILPRQEEPAGAHLEFFRVFLEHLGRVVFGVDGDRIDEDVAADPVTQDPLHLEHPGRLQRARIRTAGVDEVDCHHLALDEIVEEAHLLPLVGDQRDVGEVIGSPDRAPGPGSRYGSRP